MEAPNYHDSTIEAIQAEHRRRIVTSWGIEPGMRILEIGCGQGDLTVALAQAVGVSGHVTGVDIAPRSYGAPLTLGEATDLILKGPLGDKVDFHFQTDLRSADFSGYDMIVFAHSAWYFASLDELAGTLEAAGRCASRLGFAEWNIEPRTFEQMAHVLAVMIQGQVEAYRTHSEANVRTPFTRARFMEVLESTGWRLESEAAIESQAMQDADWEIAGCLRHGDVTGLARESGMPDKAVTWLGAQLDVLRAVAKPSGNASLDTFSVVAAR